MRCYHCTVSLGMLPAVRCPLVCYFPLYVPLRLVLLVRGFPLHSIASPPGRFSNREKLGFLVFRVCRGSESSKMHSSFFVAGEVFVHGFEESLRFSQHCSPASAAEPVHARVLTQHCDDVLRCLVCLPERGNDGKDFGKFAREFFAHGSFRCPHRPNQASSFAALSFLSCPAVFASYVAYFCHVHTYLLLWTVTRRSGASLGRGNSSFLLSSPLRSLMASCPWQATGSSMALMTASQWQVPLTLSGSYPYVSLRCTASSWSADYLFVVALSVYSCHDELNFSFRRRTMVPVRRIQTGTSIHWTCDSPSPVRIVVGVIDLFRPTARGAEARRSPSVRAACFYSMALLT